MNIIADLASLAKPITQFRTLKGNPRRGDVMSIARSLSRFGQRKPIIARTDGTIIAGNHTYAAAVHLGWDQIAAVVVDEPEEDSKGFALADNKTSQLGSIDETALRVLIEEVLDFDKTLLADASYTDKEIDKLLNPKEDIPEESELSDIGFDGDLPSTFNVIVKCHDDYMQDEVLSLLDAHGYKAEKMKAKQYA